MRALIVALQFLTRLPLPSLNGFDEDDLRRAVPWFPVVGGGLGVALMGVVWLGACIDPWLGALCGVLFWVGASGALHLDGLADLADALGAAHRDRDRFLAVLADPHIGVFGVVAVVLQLLCKLVLLMLLARMALFWVLPLVLLWARLGVWFWMRLPPLKPGLGAHFAVRVSWGMLVFQGVLWEGLSLGFPVFMLAAPGVIAAWYAFLRVRLRGMNGDALGAGVELSESGLLLVAVVAGGMMC